MEVKVDEAEEEAAARREDCDGADSNDYSNLPMVSVPIYYKILLDEIDFETVDSMRTNVNGWERVQTRETVETTPIFNDGT